MTIETPYRTDVGIYRPAAIRRGGIVVAVIALFFGLISGARMPNIWSMTHFLFDYDHGFIKRAMFGSFLGLFANNFSYYTLATIAYALFATSIALLFTLTALSARAVPLVWFFLASFFVSQGFIYLAHTVGYFDHIGLILCSLCIFLPVSVVGMLWRFALCGILILVHEGLFLFVFPIIVFDALFKIALAPRGKMTALAMTGLLVLSTSALTYAIGQTELDQAIFSDVNNYLAARAVDFVPRQDTIEVLFRDALANKELMEDIWANGMPSELLEGFLLCLPYALGLVALAAWGIACSGAQKKNLLIFLAIAAVVTPISVVVLAWDFWRFSAQMQTTAILLVLSVFFTARHALPPSLPIRLIVFLVIVTFYTATGTSGLFDGYQILRPPFTSFLKSIVSLANGQPIGFGIPDV